MSFPLINVSQFFDSSGAPLASGTIEFKDPTSNAYIDTFPTADDADAQTDANDNPLTLNARGEAATGIYLEDGVKYKIILKDSEGATIWTQDDVRCPIVHADSVQTAAESAAGVTPTDYSYPELHVMRYGSTLDAAHLQAAIDYWVAKGSGTLNLAGQTFDTGSSEIDITWTAQNREPMVLEGNGAVIAPSATIDSGNGYALKITNNTDSLLVRNKIYQNFKIAPTAGDCGGIEVDGRGGGTSGFLYRQTFNTVFVESVTKHGMFLTGNFFESQFNNCTVNIATNETGFHGIFIDEDGNADVAGDVSSIELLSCVVSGGENNVKLSGAGDSVKIFGGTYLLSGKAAVLGSTSGNLDVEIMGVHFENPWNGDAAVKSASWVSTTNQAVVDLNGRGTVRDCYCVSGTDAVRQFVRIYCTGAFTIANVKCIENGAVGDFAYICRADGTTAGRLLIQSCENLGTNGVAIVDENVAASVNFKVRDCADEGDNESIKSFTSADATPSVAGGNIYKTAGTTTITALDDGKIGQVVTIIATDSITMSVGSGFLKLSGAANYDMTDTDTLTVVFKTASIAHEIGRSVN